MRDGVKQRTYFCLLFRESSPWLPCAPGWFAGGRREDGGRGAGNRPGGSAGTETGGQHGVGVGDNQTSTAATPAAEDTN